MILQQDRIERSRRVTLLEFSAVGDADSLGGSSRARAERLHLLHHIHPVFNAAEHHVPPVQPLCFDCAYEELGSVGVRSGVSHGQATWSGVFQSEVLV